MSDAIEQFRDALSAAGMAPPNRLIADGKIHRCDVADGKKGNGAGTYKLHLDGVPAGGFCNWRGGEWIDWCAKVDRPLTAEERAIYRRRMDEQRAEAAAEAQRRQEEAAAEAATLLAAAILGEHDYLTRKSILAHGAKVFDGALLIAGRDTAGTLWTLQKIYADGKKRFLTGGRKAGCYFAMGRPDGLLILCEGFATGATINEATGHAVAVCFDCGNILAVAQTLRAKFPSLRFAIAADDDHATEGNPGVSKATAAANAVGADLIVPDFSGVPGRTDKDSDFNDLARLLGADAVRDQFARALNWPQAAPHEEEPMPFDDIAAEIELPANKARRPTIRVVAGELPAVVDQAEAALITAGLGLYQHAGRVVRAVTGDRVSAPHLVGVKAAHIREAMTVAAAFERYDGRARNWAPIDCPDDVAEAFMARKGLWRMPRLTGIITAPTLRRDGSVLDQPGFDPETGMLFLPQGIEFMPLAERPTLADARGAFVTLDDLVAEFPFIDDTARSVALSGILTAMVRPALDTAPMHAFSAHAAGSGKSLLVDIAAMIATGLPAGAISQGKTEEEMEKRLGAALIAGDQLINIDNCEQPLSGDLLCQILTQASVKVRILGQSENRPVANTASVFATGNNMIVAGDMTRRTLLCALDAGVERPELRQFATDPLALIARDRARFVHAGLTILRAYHVAGRPGKAPPLGSFGDWSNWVRSALIWMGLPDPVATMEGARESDPKREALSAVVAQWEQHIAGQRVAVKDIIALAAGQWNGEFNHPDFREALLVVAGDGGAINGRRLGKWLSRNKGMISGGRKIISDGLLKGFQMWRLA